MAIHKNPELNSTVHSFSLEIQFLILEDMLEISYYSESDVLFYSGNLNYNVLFLSIKRYIKYHC